MSTAATAIIPSLAGTSQGGEVNLHRFPTLTFAPAQHGPGIRIASTGNAAEAVYRKAAELNFPAKAQEVATAAGVTIDELFDVVRYVRDNQAQAAR